jgi:hypothetical protein
MAFLFTSKLPAEPDDLILSVAEAAWERTRRRRESDRARESAALFFRLRSARS